MRELAVYVVNISVFLKNIADAYLDHFAETIRRVPRGCRLQRDKKPDPNGIFAMKNKSELQDEASAICYLTYLHCRCKVQPRQ